MPDRANGEAQAIIEFPGDSFGIDERGDEVRRRQQATAGLQLPTQEHRQGGESEDEKAGPAGADQGCDQAGCHGNRPHGQKKPQGEVQGLARRGENQLVSLLNSLTDSAVVIAGGDEQNSEEYNL